MTHREIDKGDWTVHGMIGGERETFETGSKDIAYAIHKSWLANPDVTCVGIYVETNNG